jgi:hypothetical protein
MSGSIYPWQPIGRGLQSSRREVLVRDFLQYSVYDNRSLSAFLLAHFGRHIFVLEKPLSN